MPVFTVLRRVDAWVTHTAKVRADDAEEAAQLAEQEEERYRWRKDDVLTFDAREFVTLDTEGEEIEATRTGDF